MQCFKILYKFKNNFNFFFHPWMDKKLYLLLLVKEIPIDIFIMKMNGQFLNIQYPSVSWKMQCNKVSPYEILNKTLRSEQNKACGLSEIVAMVSEGTNHPLYLSIVNIPIAATGLSLINLDITSSTVLFVGFFVSSSV